MDSRWRKLDSWEKFDHRGGAVTIEASLSDAEVLQLSEDLQRRVINSTPITEQS